MGCRMRRLEGSREAETGRRDGSERVVVELSRVDVLLQAGAFCEQG